MKKFLFPIIIIICAVLLIVALFPDLLTGWRNDRNGDDADDVIARNIVDETGEYRFVPEFMLLSALTSDLPNIRNITITGNTLFFTSTTEVTWDSLFRTTRLFRIDLDESVLTYLPNYIEPYRPLGAEGGGTVINDIQVDDDGNIWVLEFGSYVTYDFHPGFNPEGAEMSEIWEHSDSLGTFNHIRKLDNTGAELQSIDITHLTSDIFSINLDSNGYIYAGSQQTIYS